MRILIAGSSGYLGQKLVAKFSQDHELILPLRNDYDQSLNNQSSQEIYYKNYQELSEIFGKTKPDIELTHYKIWQT